MAWGAWPSIAAAAVFSTLGPRVPIPFGSTDGEPGEAMEGIELVSAGDERNHASCAAADTEADTKADADAGASGDGLAAGGKLGIGVAVPGTFVFAGVNAGAGVAPGAAATLVVWIFPSEPPSA